MGTFFDPIARTYDQKFEFLLAARRSKTGKRGKSLVIPVSSIVDVNDVIENAIIIDRNQIKDVYPSIQKNQTKIAASWLLEIQTADYLE